MTVTEPMTMLTDYLLAGLCLYCSGSLFSRSRKRQARMTGLWIAAFGVTAFAALAGGTAHGFRVPLAERWDVVWSVTVWSIAGASLLLIAAGADSHLRPGARSEVGRREGISWLKRAIAATLVGLGLLLGRVSLHQHLNQNDLYHIAQMLGLYFLYRGALLLRGLDSPTAAPGQYHRPAST